MKRSPRPKPAEPTRKLKARVPRCLGRNIEAAARALSAAVDRIAELQPEYDEVNLNGPDATRWEVWYTEKWHPAESAVNAATDQLVELMHDQGISALFVGGRLFTDIGGDVVEGLTHYPESIGVHSLGAVRGMVPAGEEEVETDADALTDEGAEFTADDRQRHVTEVIERKGWEWAYWKLLGD